MKFFFLTAQSINCVKQDDCVHGADDLSCDQNGMSKMILGGYKLVQQLVKCSIYGNNLVNWCTIQYEARDEALIAHKSEANLTNKLINSQNIIRLSLETKESESNELGWSSLQSHISLRTLILVGPVKDQTSLKTLSGINNIPRSFCGLTNLSLQLCGLEDVSCSSFSIKTRLGEKLHLRYLSLICTTRNGDTHRLVKEEEQQQMEKVFDELCPPPCLEKLRIKRELFYELIRGYFGQRLPRWMMSTAIAPLGSLRILTMEDLPCCIELPGGFAPAIKRVGAEFLLPHHHENPSSVQSLGSDLEIQLSTCSGLEKISNLPKLQNLGISRCPRLKALEGLPALERLELEDYDMETLPGYLQDVNPSHLQIVCNVSLLTSIAKGKSS
ncbi:hypothetical protein SETIT_8G048700v2 [Setaria italica]|uniref:R13L1/DRL21-like LRR repeat region domain-containing protein n=1 Tax=Setaria italica TaxID=4555 RepID=A0A368S4B2_SETIT|nr:hypothetical protein SETIT_8G048700v2 [Setaria italica]